MSTFMAGFLGQQRSAARRTAPASVWRGSTAAGRQLPGTGPVALQQSRRNVTVCYDKRTHLMISRLRISSKLLVLVGAMLVAMLFIGGYGMRTVLVGQARAERDLSHNQAV